MSRAVTCRLAVLCILLGLAPYTLPPPIRAPLPAGEECTIAVLTGAATPDGRPILWKNRDAANLNNEVAYFTDGTYRYVALINAGDTGNAWIGVNERGFAILNALSYNLPDTYQGGITNGILMKRALQTCATVGDFKDLMVQTNASGRENPANLAVIDAMGGAEIYEAGNFTFRALRRRRTRRWRRWASSCGRTSPSPPTRAVPTPGATTGAADLVKDAVADSVGGRRLPPAIGRAGPAGDRPRSRTRSPMRARRRAGRIAVGYVNTNNTINRRTTVAGGAIHGVLPGEDPLLSTFWSVLGQPIFAIPVPVWVAGGTTPAELDGPNTAPFCDAASFARAQGVRLPVLESLLNTHELVNDTRYGYLTQCQRIERWLLPDVQRNVALWRTQGIDPEQVAVYEHRISADAYARYMNPDWRMPV